MSISYYGHNEASKELFRQQLIENPPQVISLDVETISLDERIPIGFAIATSPTDSWYFRVYPEPDREIELVKSLLNNPKIKKAIHNAIFDLRVFPLVYQIDESNIVDTNVMARLLGYQETKLPILALDLLKRILATAEGLMKEYNAKTMLGVPPEEVAAMCASHATATLQLYHEFVDKVDKDYLAVEMKVIPILIDMSQRGMKINQKDRGELEEKVAIETEYYRQICAEEDINAGSNQQVGYLLSKRGNFLPFTKSKKNLKVDVEQLEFLDDPIAAAVLGFRKANKNLTTYIRPLAGLDRVYTEYNLDAVVGRISSARINLQNIPVSDRYIYEPDTGIYTTGDWSQEHLYILMYKSGDKQMERVYYDGEFEGDIHLFTAKEMNVPRRLAKTLNYAMLYGATPKTISFHSKIRDLKRCSRLLDLWFETFPDAAAWIRGVQEEGLRSGWAEPTLFGRRIRVPEETNQWGKPNIEGMKRKFVNYPILGSDGEIMKRGLIICEEKKLPLAVTVHDSITCLHPDTPVLTSDLLWKPIKDIGQGEKLVGIDECKENKAHRHLRESVVLAKYEKEAEAYIIVLDNDEIIVSSGDHKWLALNLERKRTHGVVSPKTGWVRTDELIAGTELKYIGKPWLTIDSWKHGYIAGLLDGEGSIGKSAINFTQDTGIVLDNYVSILKSLGFTPHTYKHAGGKVVNVSKLQENLRLLGITRPARLLAKAQAYWVGYVPQFDKATVVLSRKLPGMVKLIDIQTSTKTFIANGLVSHNCDGNIEFPVEQLENIAPVRIPFKVTQSARWE